MINETLDGELQDLEYDWEHTDDTIVKTINKAIDIRKQDKCPACNHGSKTSYLKATLKQIERRNEPGIFKGHNRDNQSCLT